MTTPSTTQEQRLAHLREVRRIQRMKEAGPDLYSALEGLLACFEVTSATTGVTAVEEAARAALKKARG